jgi:diphosphomevalonate decarboxylase
VLRIKVFMILVQEYMRNLVLHLSESEGRVFTAEASPNIALIKYWGKRDEKRILPYNSSLSMTFEHKTFRTVTSIAFSKKIKEDLFYLNGVRQNLSDREIMERFSILNLLRKMAGRRERAVVVSRNYFPTASGMASSASGIAALAYAANAALDLGLGRKELSRIARQGSGSACRSIFGGIVIWHRGSSPDGRDSYAEQLFDEKYWQDFISITAVVSSSAKKVSSRAGMRQTVETNPLFGARPESAEARLHDLVNAYARRDISGVAACAMADSNEMHALMMSTSPPIRYLNAASHAIMDAVESINNDAGEIIAGYTFDAGPNANIITIERHREEITRALAPLMKKGIVKGIKVSHAGTGPVLLDSRWSMMGKKELRMLK